MTRDGGPLVTARTDADVRGPAQGRPRAGFTTRPPCYSSCDVRPQPRRNAAVRDGRARGGAGRLALSWPPARHVDLSQGRRRSRRDERPAEGVPVRRRRACRRRAAGGRARDAVAGRQPQARLPPRRRQPRVERGDAGRRPCHALPVHAGRLRVRLRVLPDRHHGPRTQSHRRRDPRPGPPGERRGARDASRLHGHGGAARELRRAREDAEDPDRCEAGARLLAAADHGLHRRPRDRYREARAREPESQPRHFAARRLRRGPLAPHAGEPRLEPRDAHGGRAALPAGAAAARVLRVRAARRRERRAGGRAAAGAPAAQRAGEGEPDSVQRLAGRGLPPAAARADPRVPVDPPRGRHHHDRALEQGRGHRRRLRPAEGSGGVRVAFATLGCRLNQVDSQQLQSALEARGFATVPFGAPADVVVVNTCTVTARAEVSDRQAIRRARRANPDARVVVTGCWAQTSAAEVAREAGVDLIVGNAEKERLPALLEEVLSGPRAMARVEVGDLRGARIGAIDARPRAVGRSRAFVKIQDGCQHRCAFCIVPRARGASRSLDPGIVADQVRRLVEAGRPEITLTGIDLGHYGADLVPRTSLAVLLRELVEIEGLRWLRLSSMLPAYFTEDVLDVLTGAPAIAPHFHVPLQSGSDGVLRAMRRPYRVAMYRALVDRLASAIPRLVLGADVIAGFPGESEQDAAATEALIDTLPRTYLPVFPYSERTGTEAAGRPGRVERATIARRAARLRALGAAKSAAFRRSMVGRTDDVLVLETRDRATGGLVGLTGNYVEVVFDGPDALMRRVARVRVAGAGTPVRGEMVA